MAADASKRPRLPAAPPRGIFVDKFTESRAPELRALHSILADRVNNDFRSRRTKRRRTTAHDNNNRRKRRRKSGGGGGAADEAGEARDRKTVPRRIRRRAELRSNPDAGFCTSGDGTKRLRTHVWHAKRFAMTKLWGFHLPLGLPGRGRGSRALLKWYQNGAVVHDASYNTAVQLEGPEDAIMSVLRMVLVPSPSAQSEDISNSVISGAIYGTSMLHHVGAPISRAIAPVTYMWQPPYLHNGDNGGDDDDNNSDEAQGAEFCSSRRWLWVWMHASAFSEGYNTLKFACQKQMDEIGTLVSCDSLEGKLAKLDVMGSKAFQLLQKTFYPLPCDSVNSWKFKQCSTTGAELNSQFKKPSVLENEESIPPCSVLPFSVQDPRALPEKRKADVLVSAPAVVCNDIPEVEAENDVVLQKISERRELLLSSWSKPDVNGSFSNNTSLWAASNGVSPPVEENILCMEKYNLRMELFCLDNPKSGKLKTSIEGHGSRCCPILLLKNNSQVCSLMGWSVILPLSWVRVFWIALVSKGAHAIGLREKRWIACEVGLPHFPSDFPDCDAYTSFMATEAASVNQKAKKLPDAVRPLRVPIPPPWNCVRVSLKKEHPGVQETENFVEKDMVDANLLRNSKGGDCDMPSIGNYGSSYDLIVARTSNVLRDFLNEIRGNHLLLFPQAPNMSKRFLDSMKDESKVGQAHNGTGQLDSEHKLCFLRVVLRAYKEGAFEEGAVVCAPSLSDISLWTSRFCRSENVEGGLQIPQSSVSSYFKEKFPGKWELQIPQDTAVRESYRWPIGFVTTGFVRGSKKPVAEAFCEAVLLAGLRQEQWNGMPVKQRRKEIYVLVRNLRSSAYRLALATLVLENQEEDVQSL